MRRTTKLHVLLLIAPTLAAAQSGVASAENAHQSMIWEQDEDWAFFVEGTLSVYCRGDLTEQVALDGEARVSIVDGSGTAAFSGNMDAVFSPRDVSFAFSSTLPGVVRFGQNQSFLRTSVQGGRYTETDAYGDWFGDRHDLDTDCWTRAEGTWEALRLSGYILY